MIFTYSRSSPTDCTALTRKRLVLSTFLLVFHYGDVIYMHASSSLLRNWFVVYQAALRFVTGANAHTSLPTGVHLMISYMKCFNGLH